MFIIIDSEIHFRGSVTRNFSIFEQNEATIPLFT